MRAAVVERTVVLCCLFVGLGGHIVKAAEAERSDLASISLQPSYVSPSLIRESSCLREVAVSPETNVIIAIGEAGTILRSDDRGDSWHLIENMHSGEPIAAPQFGRPNRRHDDLLPLPFCEFTDVIWVSPQDVVVIGGGYEPVTGISRGVCVFSHDAGHTWHWADAHEMPRLDSIRMGGQDSQTESARFANASEPERDLAVGVIEAVGDVAEASGVNRFYSHDGGQSWVEDVRNVKPTFGAFAIHSPVPEQGIKTPTTNWIPTANGPVNVNALDQSQANVQVAVGTHGRIWRRSDSDRHWQCVRGDGRGTAVLFIANSPATVPWSLVGRESLQENRRVAVLVNADSAQALHRGRAAAAIFGVASLDLSGPLSTCSNWLNLHRPAVVVLDESLSVEARQSWMMAIEQSRMRPFSTTQKPHETWSGPQRVVLTRAMLANSQRHVSEMPGNKTADPRWQRAWYHTSVLHGNALLSGPGVLANDLAVDALMLAAPGQVSSAGIDVATLEDTSGTVRRDISLAAGLPLLPGQIRTAAESSTASHRRLQITTARMNQVSRLHAELLGTPNTPASVTKRADLADKLGQLLATTDPEDHTRLLWETLGKLKTSGIDSRTSELVFLDLLSQHGQPAAVQRWATVAIGALQKSVERRWVGDDHAGLYGWRTSTSRTDHLVDSRTLGDAPESMPRRIEGAGTQPLSPFQVMPVSYEAPYQSTGSPAPQIIVPDTKLTIWQPTRGVLPISRTPSNAVAGVAANAERAQPNARINWDYHPVVMAARGIATTKTGLHVDEATQAVAYQPPYTNDRPLLDGDDRDACWKIADLWRSDWFQTKCLADEEYYYFVIASEQASTIELSLDCDGDYWSSIAFEVASDGVRRVSVDGINTTAPVWTSAISENVADEANEIVWRAEIAISRSSLPSPIRHLRVSKPSTGASWQPMPQSAQWYPAVK
jgi:hypothetical protein